MDISLVIGFHKRSRKYLMWIFLFSLSLITKKSLAQENKLNLYENITITDKSVPTQKNEYSLPKNMQPRYAIKTNLFYLATTFTPNLAFEHTAGKNGTIEWSGSFNKWNHIGTITKNKKLSHWILRGEYRHWFNQQYKGHYLGSHVFFTRYNVSGRNVLWIFDKEHRYHGNGYGTGISYGYNWSFAHHWCLELSVGVGFVYLDYDKYDCALCSKILKAENKIYAGPTRLGVTISYVIP